VIDFRRALDGIASAEHFVAEAYTLVEG